MKKFKGSTIIETIVAMILLILMSCIFVNLYSSLLDDRHNYSELKASSIVYDLSVQTKKERIFIDEEINIGEFHVRKSFSKYSNIKGLIQMTFTVSDPNNKIISTRKELIRE